LRGTAYDSLFAFHISRWRNWQVDKYRNKHTQRSGRKMTVVSHKSLSSYADREKNWLDRKHSISIHIDKSVYRKLES
jgi:hypothetical protein